MKKVFFTFALNKSYFIFGVFGALEHFLEPFFGAFLLVLFWSFFSSLSLFSPNKLKKKKIYVLNKH